MPTRSRARSRRRAARSWPRSSRRFGGSVLLSRRRARSSGARPDRVRRSGRARPPRGDHPSRRPARGSSPRSKTPSGSGAPAVVIEAIKLVEGGLAELCDEVWLIACGPEEQRVRLAGRGASRAEFGGEDRGATRHHRPRDAARDARDRHGWRGCRHASPRAARLRGRSRAGGARLVRELEDVRPEIARAVVRRARGHGQA